MAVSPTYPGVYIDELPSAVRTIIGVPTAVAAFVGPALRGSVDKAGHITSFADFERIYGGLSGTSLMSYAVFHYYLMGGAEAEIVRVASKTAPATVDLGNGVKLDVKPPGKEGNQVRARVDLPNAADPTVYSIVIHPGSGANEAIANIKAGADANAPESLQSKLAGSQHVELAEDAVTDQAPAASPAVAGGADPFADPPAGQPAPFIQASGGVDGAVWATLDLGGSVKLAAKYPGAWGSSLRARVDYDTRQADPTDGGELYNLTVRDMGTGAEETFRNIVASAASPHRLDKALDSSQLITPAKDTDLTKRPKANKSVPDGQDPFQPEPAAPAGGGGAAAPAGGGGAAAPAAPDPAQMRFTQAVGGTDGDPPGESDFAGSEKDKTGIYALLDTDIFNILCIPPIDRDAVWGGVLSQALQLCVRRRAMLIVDPPADWQTVDDAVAGARRSAKALPISGPDTANAVVYFPRITLLDANGQSATWPPCGAIAGVWARTDGQRNVAKAPAGIDASLNGVTGLAVRLTDLENGRLNPLGVNCLRTFPVVGSVVWGARTLRGADLLADQWKYLPVRRTALFIEESLYRGTQWVVFEPNDEPLWAAIRLNVGAFMNSLFRQGMFQGRTPQEAYLVKCDKDNNPQNDIDKGIVNILVGFLPLKPAEFVLIHIQQLAGQIQV
jgi:uncharacterized protein